MFHQGARSTGGDLDSAFMPKINALLIQFGEVTQRRMRELGLRRAMVRSTHQCSLVIIIDSQALWVTAQKTSSMPTTLFLDRRQDAYPLQEVLSAAKWEFGFDEPFVIPFPAGLLEADTAERLGAVEAISQAHVQSELNRVHAQMNVVPINPIFGPASYAVDPRLTFVLMPFTDELTDIYQTFVKPVVESPDFNLVCRRADDIKSNRAVIQDIWKSLCEARFVIADLTGFNANVLYELGIAHTLGKETILIYQRGSDVKFPFDLTHIRRIEYENNAIGGRALETELRATLRAVIDATVRA
jgi:hypothetical protein